MNVDTVVRTNQSVIAPTVMISACILIQNALLGRYSSICGRLRVLVRERIDLLEKYDITEAIYSEVLQVIDRQLRALSRRYLLLQNTILILYGSIVAFLLSMFAIAIAIDFQVKLFSSIAFLLFILGTTALLVSVFLAAAEIRVSHKAIRSEVFWVLSLTEHQPSLPLKSK